jgi:hypothetical protein
MDPDPSIFVIDLQDDSKKLFEATFTSLFKDKKYKIVTKLYESRIFLLFLHNDRRIRIRIQSRIRIRIHTSASGSGSGSGMPKNMWIRIRIRIGSATLLIHLSPPESAMTLFQCCGSKAKVLHPIYDQDQAWSYYFM